MKSIVGVLAVLVFGAAPARAASLDEVIDRVQAKYRQTRNFTAEFNQKVLTRASKIPRNAGGRVYFQKPNQFRFNYTFGPEGKKYMVSDGKKVWTFVPEDSQVHIDPFNHKIAGSLRFLWGEGNLRKQFEIKLYEGKDYGKPGDHVLELVPKVSEGFYKKLIFVVDPQTFDVRETVIFDAVGTKNQMIFSSVERDVTMPPERFRLSPKVYKKEGVQIIRSPELKGDEE